MSATTLQINLSPGDVNYAALTVPALLAAHPNVQERLLIVDLCKPQATRIVDPARRFPEPAYSERAAQIETLATGWLNTGQVDRVEFLRPGDPRFVAIRRTYLRPWVTETHDYGGCALLAYLAAFAFCRTPWLLHYDADILLHQSPGFDWVASAQTAMVDSESVVAATPRPSPPLADADLPTSTELLTLHAHPAGWLNTWFSTRCYLFDLDRLRPWLPLLQGRAYWEMLASRIVRRAYPRSPETMLFRRMSSAGRWRLTLSDRRAWLLHPTRKDASFIAALPRLLTAVQAGKCPETQRGRADLQLESWREILD